MTIREVAINNLIDAEALNIRNALIKELKETLDRINESMKQYPDERMQKEYVETAARLERLKKANRISLLDIDCDSVKVPHII
jgi:predicted KAP-like P-loop ATPase